MQRCFLFGMFEEKHILHEQWERIKGSDRAYKWLLGNPTHDGQALPRRAEELKQTNKQKNHCSMGWWAFFATSEAIFALDASFRWFLPCFCGMETSMVLRGNGTIKEFAHSVLVLLCLMWHSREYPDEGCPSTINIVFFSRPGFKAMTDLCLRSSTQ